MSAMGLIVGAVFICIGIFVAIPNVGLFGVFWTLIAVAITGYHAVNLFSDCGVATEVVDFDSSSSTSTTQDAAQSVEERLKTLEQMKDSGLVSLTEYESQRSRILNDL